MRLFCPSDGPRGQLFQGLPSLSRDRAPRRRHLTACPCRPSPSIFQYLIFGTQKHDASVVHVIRNPCYNVIVESRECNCMTLRVYHDLY
jgi:hypothetical protein